MADRKDFYFRQKVTEAELDSAFDGLEVADRAIMDDQSLIGICNGLVASQAAPTPDISVDITAGVGYDQAGQRMFVPTLTNVDVSVDLNSTSTDVVGGGNSRIVGVYLEFQRVLSDPRIDGNSNTVFFQRDESFAFVVRQGAEAASPSPPPLQADEILVVDITRTFGQTQIFNADLDFSRTELMFVGSSTNLSFSERTAVAALTTVLQEIDDHIVSTTAHGSDDIDSVAVVGTPNSLALGDVLSQLTELLGFANDLAPSELTYSSNDTWNKPTNAVWVLGVVVGAGGGGGAEGATGGGAGGGGSGEVKTFSFPAVEVPSSLTVTIGAVGTGASVAEQQGGQGGLCSIQATNFLVSAAGGNGGIGGSGNVGAAGGAGGRSFYTLVGDPGAGGSPGGLGEPAVTGLGGAGGGGGGDGIGPAAGGTGGGGIGGNGGVGGSGGNGGFGGIGYGAGGGGGMTTPTTGGGGGGGGGGYTSKTGGSGFVAAQDGDGTKGGNGGSGVVIIITLRATNTI